VAIAAVTAAELLVGVELATPRHRDRRRQFVEAVLRTLPVEEYDLAVARAHARLLAEARRAGRPRDAHDLIVAATAVSTGRTLLTTDASGFAGLQGVEVRAV
jgi:tRNA(fMet)-specific endonuclease VapC